MYLLDRPEDIPPRLTSRLNLRIAILGAVVVAAIATVLLRLWSLQILDGEHYRALAQDHGVLDVRVHPPRGEILDRNGQRAGRQPDGDEPAAAPVGPAERSRRAQARARQAGRPPRPLPARDRARGSGPRPQYAGYPVVLQQGLDRQLLFYLLENKESFPGVSVERTYVRKYPDGTLAAHILGLVGQISPRQLKRPGYRGLQPGDIIGQAGVEYTYDKFLRGTAGSQRIQVDALGRPRGSLGSPARPGRRQPAPDPGLGPAGSGRVRAPLQGPARRLRRDERPHRRDPGDGLLSRPTTRPSTRSRTRRRNTTHSAIGPATRWSTAPTRAAIRRARPSSRSPPQPPSRTDLITPSTIFDDTGSLDVGGIDRSTTPAGRPTARST